MLGYDLIENPSMANWELDTTGSRSPARALRRHRQGRHPLPQREVPWPDFMIADNCIIGHPVRIKQLLDAVAAKSAEISRTMDDRLLKILNSQPYAQPMTATAIAISEPKPFTVDTLRHVLKDIEVPPRNPFFPTLPLRMKWRD